MIIKQIHHCSTLNVNAYTSSLSDTELKYILLGEDLKATLQFLQRPTRAECYDHQRICRVVTELLEKGDLESRVSKTFQQILQQKGFSERFSSRSDYIKLNKKTCSAYVQAIKHTNKEEQKKLLRLHYGSSRNLLAAVSENGSSETLVDLIKIIKELGGENLLKSMLKERNNLGFNCLNCVVQGKNIDNLKLIIHELKQLNDQTFLKQQIQAVNYEKSTCLHLSIPSAREGESDEKFFKKSQKKENQNPNAQALEILIHTIKQLDDPQFLKSMLQEEAINRHTCLYKTANIGDTDSFSLLSKEIQNLDDSEHSFLKQQLSPVGITRISYLELITSSGSYECLSELVNLLKNVDDGRFLDRMLTQNNRSKHSILHIAIRNYNHAALTFLIQTIKDRQGKEVLRTMLRKTEFGQCTPFHYATGYGSVECTQILLKTFQELGQGELKFQLETSNTPNFPPLHLAVSSGNPQVTQLVIDAMEQLEDGTLEKQLLIGIENTQKSCLFIAAITRKRYVEVRRTIVNRYAECASLILHSIEKHLGQAVLKKELSSHNYLESCIEYSRPQLFHIIFDALESLEDQKLLKEHIEKKNWNAQTLLNRAIMKQELNVAVTLIRAGADYQLISREDGKEEFYIGGESLMGCTSFDTHAFMSQAVYLAKSSKVKSARKIV